ncbi:hypothetical protein FQZ97_987590 [compost metagenome]
MGRAAGVVDQHVEPAVAFVDGGHQCLQLIEVAHVTGHEPRFAIGVARQLGRCLATADHHLGAMFQEALADAPADAFAAAGDQHHLAAEIHCIAHGCLVVKKWLQARAYAAFRPRPKGLGDIP